MRTFQKKYQQLSIYLDTAYENNDVEPQLAHMAALLEDSLFEIDRAQQLIMSGDTGPGLDILEGLKYQLMCLSLDTCESSPDH